MEGPGPDDGDCAVALASVRAAAAPDASSATASSTRTPRPRPASEAKSGIGPALRASPLLLWASEAARMRLGPDPTQSVITSGYALAE